MRSNPFETSFSTDPIEPSLVPQLLTSPIVRRVEVFALGPDGTNIQRASHRWAQARGIADKTAVTLCPTPEESMLRAREVEERGVLPIYALCAVYYRLNELYFANPDCQVFLDHNYMELDNMQLCVNGVADSGSPVFSHPSPSVLVRELAEHPTMVALSNADAARSCASLPGSMCVTTAAARALNDLTTVHEFGSPGMLFTFGTTPWGSSILHEADQARRGAGA